MRATGSARRHVHGHERLAQYFDQRADARRRDHDDAGVDEQLLLARWKDGRGQDGVVGAEVGLRLAQLGDEGVLPRRARLRVDDDLAR